MWRARGLLGRAVLARLSRKLHRIHSGFTLVCVGSSAVRGRRVANTETYIVGIVRLSING